MTQQTIYISAIAAVISGLEDSGYCANDLLLQSGIPPDCLTGGDMRLPADAFVRLAKNIIAKTDDESLCLFPRRVKSGAFLMAGRLAVHCRDLRKSLRRIVEFYNLLDCGVAFKFEEQHREAVLKIAAVSPLEVKNAIVIEIYLTAMHRFLSWLVGQSIVVKRLRLSDASAVQSDAYMRTFACDPIVGSGDDNSLSFSADCLEFPITRTEKEFLEFSAQHAGYLFEPVTGGGSELSMRVRSQIAESLELHNHVPELDDLRNSLGMSGRSIAMQLRREGLRFRNVVTIVRREMAMRYISDSVLSLEEIASRTGYSELSAFSRAFKVWTDLAPKDYRKRVGTDKRRGSARKLFSRDSLLQHCDRQVQ